MFWEIEEIEPIRLEPIKLDKTIKSNKTLWFYYKPYNLYIEKNGNKYESICFKDKNTWKRIFLTNVNFSARKDNSKLIWTRYKLGNQKIKTILYPKEFVEVDDSEINGLLSFIIGKSKEKLSDGWYQCFDYGVEYLLKSEGDILTSVYCETEERFILNFHFQQKFYTMYEKLDESHKIHLVHFINELEEKLKKQFLI